MRQENIYTYTIFDSDPNRSSGTAWPNHEDIEIEADLDHDALDTVREILSVEAASLNPTDGYEVGDRIYAIIWDSFGVIVGNISYELTTEDLGIEL